MSQRDVEHENEREKDREGGEGCEYAVTTEGSEPEKCKNKHGRTILTS